MSSSPPLPATPSRAALLRCPAPSQRLPRACIAPRQAGLGSPGGVLNELRSLWRWGLPRSSSDSGSGGSISSSAAAQQRSSGRSSSSLRSSSTSSTSSTSTSTSTSTSAAAGAAAAAAADAAAAAAATATTTTATTAAAAFVAAAAAAGAGAAAAAAAAAAASGRAPAQLCEHLALDSTSRRQPGFPRASQATHLAPLAALCLRSGCDWPGRGRRQVSSRTRRSLR